MLNVNMLSVILLNDGLLSVVKLSVVAPSRKCEFKKRAVPFYGHSNIFT